MSYKQERDVAIALELGKCCHPPIDVQVLLTIKELVDWGHSYAKQMGEDQVQAAMDRLTYEQRCGDELREELEKLKATIRRQEKHMKRK